MRHTAIVPPKTSRLRDSDPLVNSFTSILVDLVAPTTLSYLWNFGSLLGITLVLQIVSGLILTMHYTPHTLLAFDSVEHIMRDVHQGWLLRYTHANGASLFFILVFAHIGRGIYYGSYTYPRQKVWGIGIILFFLIMGTAFLGYVLPWGQISFWGATVITNLVSAIPVLGTDIVYWVWGGFSVDNPTLNRFFALHFLLPFLLAALSLVYLIYLYINGSNNPNGTDSTTDTTTFHPYYSSKDFHGFIIMIMGLSLLVFFSPNLLGHPDNYIEANPLVTPTSIVPEWYFLFAYAILRSIPNKLGGVLALLLSILILGILPLAHTAYLKSMKFRPLARPGFWVLVATFFLLTWLGGNHVEYPFVQLGQILSVLYFLYFLAWTPLSGLAENVLLWPALHHSMLNRVLSSRKW